MTVIHTETHLTSDPVYCEDSAYFNVALSNISVECHIHREECINYLRENKVRIGDLVKIGGVFITETKPEQAHYLNVNSICLASSDGSNNKRRKVLHDDGVSLNASNNKCVSCVFRRLDEHIDQRVRSTLLLASNSTLRRSSNGIYTEFTGSFSEYFFMIYGEASYVTFMISQHLIPNDAIAEEFHKQRTEMFDNVTRAYTIFTEMSYHGINEAGLNNFVSSVASLVEKIYRLKQFYSVHVPVGLVIDTTVPLPSTIYHNYIKE
ncbi:hypothetical protein CU097_008233 [Rhizopus azygosporus]|uniref:Uncharacterized protein n=2 Tax=Rhizopus TaxID=4842 RepID=A0A367JZU3_RHIAZ|nr:hypothetical protein BCV71DRAFT_232662 [Rhizopus microsporus]RCH95456.1 hypothetical protein CU097_008233 [Rhizopus azygosporus]